MDGKKHGSEDRKHREQRREEEKRREEGGEKKAYFSVFFRTNNLWPKQRFEELDTITEILMPHLVCQQSKMTFKMIPNPLHVR